MNAIPLINNAPRPNINVGSIGSPTFNPVAAGAKLGGSIGGNVMRQNPASMPVNNETQLRQEVNTSIVALKREAFSLENLIAQAAQTLQDINKRLSELEGKQGDYVKKNDVVDSITSGNMNPVTSNAVANSNAMPVDTVSSGNMHSVTSNAVANLLNTNLDDNSPVEITSQLTKSLGLSRVIAFRRNNIVQLWLYGDYTGQPSVGTQTLASGVPQKYRPYAPDISNSFAVVSYISSNPYVVPSRVALNGNGDILLSETSMPNGAKIVFGFCYIGA